MSCPSRGAFRLNSVLLDRLSTAHSCRSHGCSSSAVAAHIAAIRCASSITTAADVWTADFAVIRSGAFAEAAFARGRGILIVAARRVSPIRSFAGVVFALTETVPSPQLGRTIRTQDMAGIETLILVSCLN